MHLVINMIPVHGSQAVFPVSQCVGVVCKKTGNRQLLLCPSVPFCIISHMLAVDSSKRGFNMIPFTQYFLLLLLTHYANF